MFVFVIPTYEIKRKRREEIKLKKVDFLLPLRDWYSGKNIFHSYLLTIFPDSILNSFDIENLI